MQKAPASMSTWSMTAESSCFNVYLEEDSRKLLLQCLPGERKTAESSCFNVYWEKTAESSCFNVYLKEDSRKLLLQYLPGGRQQKAPASMYT